MYMAVVWHYGATETDILSGLPCLSTEKLM